MSGTKAEESSGFNNPFPQSGNDKRVTPADREKSQFVSHPDSACLDSSLRWNDDGGMGLVFLYSGQPALDGKKGRGTKSLVIPAQAGIQCLTQAIAAKRE